MIKFGSVCSGIEAASIAWEPLGMSAAWLSEIEPFPAAVLAHRWPTVPNLGDMTLVAQYVKLGLIDAPDVLVGGTPCQAFSIAGLRKGLNDHRGQLTLEFIRIANEIDEQRKGNECVIVWENVPGVLSSKDNAFGNFLAGIVGDDEPLDTGEKPKKGKSNDRYKWDKKQGCHVPKWAKSGLVIGPQRSAAWRILDAQYFGVAQRRRRVFVVASAREGFDPGQVLFESEGVRRDTPPSREKKEEFTGAIASRAAESRVQPFELANCLTARMHKGINSTVDEGQTPVISDAAVPPIDASYGRLQGCSGQDLNHGHGHLLPYAFQPRIGRNGRGDMGELVNALSAESGKTGKGDAAPCVAVAHVETMGTMVSGGGTKGSHNQMSGQFREEYLVPAVAFSSKDYGADASSDLVPTLRAGGHDTSHANGGAPPAVAFAQNSRDELRILEVPGALSAGGGKPGQGYPALAGPTGVRRLTPKECERLQGIVDEHTRIPWRYNTIEGCPDGPRYKAIGNSMAVPVMQWIGIRILNHLEAI